MSEAGFEYGEFALISNPEWMTIARDLESVTGNWSGSSVGSGCVFNGNHGTDDTCGYNGADPEGGTGRNTRAKLTLSSGEEIWDFSGNVWEWVDWNPNDSGFTTGPTTCNNTWTEFSTKCTALSLRDYQPAGAYNSNHGMGQWYGSTGGAAARGGVYNAGSSVSGLYGIILHNNAAYSDGGFGFRCVWRP